MVPLRNRLLASAGVAPAVHGISSDGDVASQDRMGSCCSTIYLVKPTEAAPALGIAVQTLARGRCEGSGPRFVRVGGRIAYRPSDIEAWLAGRVVASTSETSAYTAPPPKRRSAA